MSTRPSPGTYYIVNKANTPSGGSLALTYNGEGKTVTVTELDNLPTQLWVIEFFNEILQYVSPQTKPGLRVGLKDSSDDLFTIPPSGLQTVWSIRSDDSSSYTFSGRYFPPSVWSIQTVTSGVPVFSTQLTGNDTQKWQLVRA